jgi:hypothetical protein
VNSQGMGGALGFWQSGIPVRLRTSFTASCESQNRSKVTLEFGIAKARTKSSVCPHTNSFNHFVRSAAPILSVWPLTPELEKFKSLTSLDLSGRYDRCDNSWL